MKVSREENILGDIISNNNKNCNIKVGHYTFERVDSFRYPETLIYNKNNMHQEIQQKINNANRDYFLIVIAYLNQNYSLENLK